MADQSHVEINGAKYRVDLGSYRGRDISDWSPRASVPGGGIVFSEMSLYQPVNQTDFRHGFGFDWHTDAAGYWKTLGNVETREPGIVRIGPLKAAITGANTNSFTRIFKGVLGYYWTTATECYTSAPDGEDSTMKKQNVLSGVGPIKYVFTNGTYDFVSLDNSTLRLLRLTSTSSFGPYTASGGSANTIVDAGASWDDDAFNGMLLYITSGTGVGQARVITDCVASTDTITVTPNWTNNPNATSVFEILPAYQAGVNANSTGYTWITHHDGYVYACKEDNLVYFGSAATLSDLHGAAADDTDEIVVGMPSKVLGAISYNGDLFFIKTNSIYKMDKDRTAARMILDYTDSPGIRSWAVYNGTLVFTIGSNIIQWNGTRTTTISPPAITRTFPYTYYTKFSGMVISGNYLYCVGTWSKPIAAEVYPQGGDLLVYDGVGCIKLCTLWEGSSAGIYAPSERNMMALKQGLYGTNWMYMALPIIPTVTTSAAFEIQLNGRSLTMQSDTASTNALITSKIDAGFRRIQKSTPSLLIEAENLSANQYILVYYSLNDGAYTAWGGTDGTTNKIVNTGVTELTNPLGTTGSTIEYYWIKLKFVLVTTSSASSPVLAGYTLRLLMRPDTDYGYSFNIIGAREAEYGNMGPVDSRDPHAIIADLHTARDSKAPITFVDIWGTSHKAYLTSVTEVAVEEHIDDQGAYRNIEQAVSVNLVLVG